MSITDLQIEVLAKGQGPLAAAGQSVHEVHSVSWRLPLDWGNRRDHAARGQARLDRFGLVANHQLHDGQARL